MFINEKVLDECTWQAFERLVCRLLLYEGYDGIRLVGQTKDQGADIIAHKFNKRWLIQVKYWKKRVGLDVVDRTLSALASYRAHVPVIVALNGFDSNAQEHQRALLSRGIPLQLIGRDELLKRAANLSRNPTIHYHPRDYQEEAIRTIVQTYSEEYARKALIVMATGLGKTFTAAEALRRINSISLVKVLVIAHTNELVYQLERAFWPLLTPEQETLVWNGYEQPTLDHIKRSNFIFACLNTVSDFIKKGAELPACDIILIDECHHVGGEMYMSILRSTSAGQKDGPFLLGLTATPWRPDEVDIKEYFGEPLYSIDIVSGLKRGYLTNVDYRMYTDNINWEALRNLKGSRFSPRQINRTLFISEWDDAVVYELRAAWKEQLNPRAIVFCGTIDHAITMRDRINSLGFANSSAIYSQTSGGQSMTQYDRNRILCDFTDGSISIICAVDIFNEGIDVPDVNIIVFQRVTHSRRIFVQQLGRGLRIAPGKEKVIVLDFVSDIRRFAAGLTLKDDLCGGIGPRPGGPVRLQLKNKISFRKVGEDDPRTENFLRQWLEDIAAIEGAGEDTSVLKFPPSL